jgi:hypothetical protein
MASLKNDATQYLTGDEFHAEWAVGYKFDNGLILGVAGYDYRQITGDSRSFLGTEDAVGPSLSYSTIIGKAVSLASFTAAFPAGQALESPAKGMKD